jgi:hypothetical protein
VDEGEAEAEGEDGLARAGVFVLSASTMWITLITKMKKI